MAFVYGARNDIPEAFDGPPLRPLLATMSAFYTYSRGLMKDLPNVL